MLKTQHKVSFFQLRLESIPDRVIYIVSLYRLRLKAGKHQEYESKLTMILKKNSISKKNEDILIQLHFESKKQNCIQATQKSIIDLLPEIYIALKNISEEDTI